MDLYLYNSLSKKKELFSSIKGKQVSVYTCGPTVYWFAHIGNLSSYLMADILIRVLEALEYEVFHVKNITDVGHLVSDGDDGEDKMEKAAKKEQKDPYEIAAFYANAYIQDEQKLRMREPQARPKATDYVESMLKMVEDLIYRGYAYETSDGIYMDISKIEDYGVLSGNLVSELQAGARVEINDDKKHPADFALWKKADPNHLMQWDSPWGRSFPGWHMECSAMAWEYFHDTYDIKTGGEDNIFPHHECEIAQTQALFDKKLANYFLHKRHIQLDGMKLSKSSGSIITLTDLLEKGYTAEAVRFALISSHYRNRLNFQEALLHEGQKLIDRGNELIQKLWKKRDIQKEKPVFEIGELPYFRAFLEALCDDLNMPEALVHVHELIRQTNSDRDQLTPREAERILQEFQGINGILHIFDCEMKQGDDIPQRIYDLVNKRLDAKERKDFAQADLLREEILSLGFEILDTKDGAEIKRL